MRAGRVGSSGGSEWCYSNSCAPEGLVAIRPEITFDPDAPLGGILAVTVRTTSRNSQTQDAGSGLTMVRPCARHNRYPRDYRLDNYRFTLRFSMEGGRNPLT